MSLILHQNFRSQGELLDWTTASRRQRRHEESADKVAQGKIAHWGSEIQATPMWGPDMMFPSPVPHRHSKGDSTQAIPIWGAMLMQINIAHGLIGGPITPHEKPNS